MSFLSWLFFWRRKHKPTPTAPTVPVNSGGGSDRALLVGINSYPGAPLSGCVNDVKNIKELLLTKYGFKEENIVMLTERDATTQNIKDKLTWLCGAVPGSRAYLHYSGHGVQVPVDDEPDGLAEAICPVDFDWTTDHMLTDKQLIALLKQMPVGVRFNWASDSCHSGDLDRGLKKNPHTVIPRTIPHPPKIAEIIFTRKRRNGKMRTMRGMVNGVLDVGFISGCRSDQTSADTVLGGNPCGAFTYFLVESLKKLQDGADSVTIAKETAKALVNNNYEQIPQVDGAQQNKPFLRF